MKKLFTLLSIVSLSAQAQFLSPDTIPVIVHVVHNGESLGTGRNLAQAQVMSQFAVLNADFAGQGWNVSNVPAVWSSLIANTQIVFVPAVVDTNGAPLAEPGIDRIDRNSRGWQNTATMNSSNLQSYLNTTIKPQSIWNTNDYCNVWVLDMGAAGLLGYSTFPAGSGLPWITGGTGTPTTDGVCIHYKVWGDTLNLMAPYNHGRTATHEFGHWFGLPHMSAGCGAQVIADLPVGMYNQWFTSPVFPDVADTCAGYPDGPMFMNFMCNTVSDSDIYMFTSGQANAMRQAITNSRSSLLTSQVWNTTGIKTTEGNNTVVTLYPNPASGAIIVKAGSAAELSTLKLYNVLGHFVKEITVSGTEARVDLSACAAGVYFMQVITAKGQATVHRFVVEK